MRPALVAALMSVLPWFTPAKAQQPAAPAPAPVPVTAAPASIGAAWDNLVKDTIPQAPVDPVLTQAQAPVTKGPAGDFLNHFFFEARSTYEHSALDFTGLATNGGIVPGPVTGIFNPNGFPFPPVFEPDANRLYTFLDFGTRGWGSDRVNTHFGIRYRQDLTTVDIASSNANVLETFGSRRLIELVQGSVEINSKPTDGAWAGTSLQLGRQDVYGAEYASLDGAAFHLDRGRFALTLFGGRRFTYFSDPDQRAIGGGSLLFRPDPKTSISYDTLFYVHGTHKVSIRRRLGDHWVVAAYFRAYGGAPVDFNAQAFYHSRSGRTSARVSFFQKLTDKDYFYDFTVAARDLDPKNTLFRLNLNPLNPYSLFVADGRHAFSSRFSLGGAVAVQRLNDNRDQNDFQTSYVDYRVTAQLVPVRRVGLDFDYHQHDSDRLPPPSTGSIFDAISTSGETSVRDLTAQIRRSFGEGRLTLNGGAYYRRISLQDRFFVIDGSHQSGWLAGARLKLDDHTRILFDYALDNDFFVLRPAISDARILRVGVAWKY